MVAKTGARPFVSAVDAVACFVIVFFGGFVLACVDLLCVEEKAA